MNSILLQEIRRAFRGGGSSLMEGELHCLHKECAVEIKLEDQTSCNLLQVMSMNGAEYG
jgi:hypothetical protein